MNRHGAKITTVISAPIQVNSVFVSYYILNNSLPIGNSGEVNKLINQENMTIAKLFVILLVTIPHFFHSPI